MTLRFKSEERLEESIFASNQLLEAVKWITHREDYKLSFRIMGDWIYSDSKKSNESIPGYFYGEGRVLVNWDGKTFQNDLYLIVDKASIGEASDIIVPRFIHLSRAMISDELRLSIDNITLINRFERYTQNTLFFLKDEYKLAYEQIKALIDKFEILLTIEGEITTNEGKNILALLKGPVKHTQNKEIFIEVEKIINLDETNKDSISENELKAIIKKRWLFRVASKGKNRIHPRYILAELNKEVGTTDKALDVQDLYVAYDENVVLKGNVNFDVLQGEILGIIGESGAGKSTTMKAILGEVAFEGKISIFGIDGQKTKKISPLIGYIPQDLSRMYQQFSPLENILAFASQYNIPERIVLERGKHILEDLGIAISRPVRDLSGGQKRRASIAIAMAHNPRMLFLDEPTSGLDPHTRFELWKYLDIINKQYGTTLVVISHYLDEIEFCDKAALFLNKFGFYDYGTPENLKRKLPGSGLAIEVTLEEVTIEALDILRNIEGVEFVVQRGERFRILSNSPTDTIAERVLSALKENSINYHGIEFRVNIDMIDYFSYVSVLRDKKFGTKTE